MRLEEVPDRGAGIDLRRRLAQSLDRDRSRPCVAAAVDDVEDDFATESWQPDHVLACALRSRYVHR